jgi:phosphoribosyl 1,2-cyclic phosphodiesterase
VEPLYIASINSGSNGNCYYVGNDTEAVLVDAGLSCRETERRMARIGLNMKHVKALFISHEHTDHIRGVQTIANKHRIPVYITAATLQHSRVKIDRELIMPFSPYEPVQIGGLSVSAFPKQHDAIDPFSFIIRGNGVTVGVFTDIGVTCEHLTGNFKECHAAFLEANYDEAMLEEGNYPIHLKMRIRGGKGHLSNREALELFMTHRPEYMSHLLLSHLSKNNNRPELVSELFSPYAGEMNIVVASRYNESEVYRVHSYSKDKATTIGNRKTVQASLF